MGFCSSYSWLLRSGLVTQGDDESNYYQIVQRPCPSVAQLPRWFSLFFLNSIYFCKGVFTDGRSPISTTPNLYNESYPVISSGTVTFTPTFPNSQPIAQRADSLGRFGRGEKDVHSCCLL